ncbi:MAG: BrnT family toxin [Pseudomonadota bacterium]
MVAFADPLGLDGPDVLHSQREIRYIRVADSGDGTILTIVYTIRMEANGTQKIRIISARKASRKERSAYEKAQ